MLIIHNTSWPNDSPPIIRANGATSVATTPLINRIQTLIEAIVLKIGGIFISFPVLTFESIIPLIVNHSLNVCVDNSVTYGYDDSGNRYTRLEILVDSSGAFSLHGRLILLFRCEVLSKAD